MSRVAWFLVGSGSIGVVTLRRVFPRFTSTPQALSLLRIFCVPSMGGFGKGGVALTVVAGTGSAGIGGAGLWNVLGGGFCDVAGGVC